MGWEEFSLLAKFALSSQMSGITTLSVRKSDDLGFQNFFKAGETDIDVQVDDNDIGLSLTDPAGRLKDTAMDACRADLMRVASEAKTDWCSGISSLHLGSVSRTVLMLAV